MLNHKNICFQTGHVPPRKVAQIHISNFISKRSLVQLWCFKGDMNLANLEPTPPKKKKNNQLINDYEWHTPKHLSPPSMEVVGFHGDAITVTLPALASGLELRRRVQEQLPPKPGAKEWRIVELEPTKNVETHLKPQWFGLDLPPEIRVRVASHKLYVMSSWRLHPGWGGYCYLEKN